MRAAFPAHSLTTIFVMWLAADTKPWHAACANLYRKGDRRPKPADRSPLSAPPILPAAQPSKNEPDQPLEFPGGIPRQKQRTETVSSITG